MRKSRYLLALCLAACGASAQYTVEILHSGLVPAANSYGAGAGGGQQVGHTNQFLFGPSHALLWSGTANSLVDLHPAGWDGSYAMATDGVRQVGWRERHTGNAGQFATMWSGSAKGWVDLHDPAYNESNALGISGDMQVGFGYLTTAGTRAVLWRNTAGSIVNLHPVGFDFSRAFGTDGKQQVGFAATGATGRHAALWTGTAKSHVDLHPAGYAASEAMGVVAGQQVGYANLAGNKHAGLWFGTSGSFIDMNPGPTSEVGSELWATNGFNQVGVTRGFKLTGGQFHASLWSGTSASWSDLHTYLPADYIGPAGFSTASGIDEAGNIIGWATHLQTGANHAILWRPVPEPHGMTALGLLTLLIVVQKKQRGY